MALKPKSDQASPAADIAHGKAVLEQEIKGIKALSDTLGDEFAQAVSCLSGIRGRVIVSGMGKSGHVARKIAATMASTGTPSHFVHPGEASHGDLGMITKDDAVLALSNSGETEELKDIIAYTRRFKIPLIAMIGRSKSLLGSAADIPLILPEIAEASVMAVPTTSTTMMLALGDALAISLLERKGFNREHYKELHPRGRLGGTLLLRVKDLMHPLKDMPFVDKQELMSNAIVVMTAKSFGCAAVIKEKDNKKVLVGIITDGDLRRHITDDNLLKKKVGDVMTKPALIIEPEALAATALAVMNEKQITSLIVAEVIGEDRIPQGILHIHDCLRAGVA